MKSFVHTLSNVAAIIWIIAGVVVLEIISHHL
jgi:hypothetical protein